MKIISVIPITNIPKSYAQVLTYFTLHNICVGSLVLAPIHQRQVTAVVIKIQDIKQVKIFLRKRAGYALKPISKIISKEALIPGSHIKLAYWLAEYYACSLTLAFKTILPESLRDRKSRLLIPKFQILYSKFQILHLVPNLQNIEKIKKSYKNKNKKIAIYHGSLSRGTQFQAWQEIRSGSAQVIIGTRLACFAPFNNLKKIIIEQEESDNYKSWDMKPYYDARHVIEKLIKLHNAKLEEQSIIPPIKLSIINYQLSIKNKEIKIIDMRNQQGASEKFIIFSEQLINAIKKILQKNGQVILFHNRKGMGRFMLCKKCGFAPKCPNCAVSLLDYKTVLQCNHCNFQANKQSICPNCADSQLISFGIGTQKIEKEIKKIFSQTHVMRLDTDIPEKKRTKIMDSFKKKKINILIGTQMLLQYDFSADLSAVINADSSLNLPDFRASEQSFYIFTNLALQTKKLIIQTYNPKHFALNAIYKKDPEDFYKQELAVRKKFFYPPFSKLIKLSFKHYNKHYAKNSAVALAERMNNFNAQIIGPVPGFSPRIKNQYIYQIIIKLPLKSSKTKKALLNLVPDYWIIDVDPVSLL